MVPLNIQNPATEGTPQEMKIAHYLSELGLRWEAQRQFGKYKVDFWIDELKVVIEADGPYGHLSKREKIRTEFLLGNGVEHVLRVRDNSIKDIRKAIDAFLENEDRWA